jgi:hypothetical protein
MKGAMLTFLPYEAKPSAVLPLAGAPSLSDLQKAVAGFIEAVPGFDTIEHDGAARPCVAFCNEDGKGDGLPVNNLATVLWDQALRRGGGRGLLQPNGVPADVLVGPVVVIVGDRALLEAL